MKTVYPFSVKLLVGLWFGAILSLAAAPSVSAQTPPCGSAALPACDGECPLGQTCMDAGGGCACQPLPMPCGVVQGAPLCWGECPPLTACVDAGGFCECAVVPTLSEWGIMLMAAVMFGSVLHLRRRRGHSQS